MIKNSRLLARLERTLIKHESLSYIQRLKIAESLWEEGRALGVLPPRDPLEGIETDIRIARILNQCSDNLS
jgi:hypothetical protein